MSGHAVSPNGCPGGLPHRQAEERKMQERGARATSCDLYKYVSDHVLLTVPQQRQMTTGSLRVI